MFYNYINYKKGLLIFILWEQQKNCPPICGDTANLLHMAERLQLGVIGQVQVIPCAIMQQVFGAVQSSPLYRTT